MGRKQNELSVAWADAFMLSLCVWEGLCSVSERKGWEVESVLSKYLTYE